MDLDDLKVVYPKKDIFENAEHYARRCVRTAINDYANPNYKQVQAKANLRQEKINELKQIIKTKDQELAYKQIELNQTTTELQWYKGFFGIIREKFKRLGSTVGKMLIEDLLSKVTNDLIPFYDKIKKDLDSINEITPKEGVLTSSNKLNTKNKR